MKSNVIKYYCSEDGGIWNVEGRLIHSIAGLWIVHVVKSELIGPVGTDGEVYAFVTERHLFSEPQ